MKTLRNISIIFFFLIVGIILISYIIWLGYEKKQLNLFVLDKTVKDFTYSNHRSLYWVLNNSRIIKRNGNNYNYRKDYYGFFPEKPLSDREYKIKRVQLTQIDSLAREYDALYYTDSYGIYFSEWFRGFKEVNESSLIDGGLNQNDFILLKEMKDKKKLVILEYNTLGTPTSDLIRYKTGILFGIEPSGWAGKYFEELDSANNEVPRNIIAKYSMVNNRQWPFKGPGIIIINNDNIIVLQKGLHLQTEKPEIDTRSEYQEKYKLPENITYLNWFEIISTADTNEIVADYSLNLTDSGDSILRAYNLSASFPAIISSHQNGLNLYYFAGDFANTPVNSFFAKLANSRKLLALITNDERKLFFQNFYFPLLENIMINYISSKKKSSVMAKLAPK